MSWAAFSYKNYQQCGPFASEGQKHKFYFYLRKMNKMV